jgi:protein-L-isoaspartate(D-aspartate) O-methyltransferase
MPVVTMDMEQARFNMIEQQIRPWQVLDPEVLRLLGTVRREDFVPAAHRALAFADIELPIGNGQTMLQPKVEARIFQELAIKNTDIVLEVGAGSGFMAALLAAKAEFVYSVEIDPLLAENAKTKSAAGRRCQRQPSKPATHPRAGLQSRSLSTSLSSPAHCPNCPKQILQQLKIGGRLAAFVGEAPAMYARIVTTHRDENAFNSINVFETLIVATPLLPRQSRASVSSSDRRSTTRCTSSRQSSWHSGWRPARSSPDTPERRCCRLATTTAPA